MSHLHRLLLGAFLVAAGATPARAFVRSTTNHGTPIFWPSGCVFIQADTDMPTDLSAQGLADTLARSIANWQSVTLATGCSYLQFHIDPPAAAETAADYKNVVKFRSGDPTTARFCRPAAGKVAEVCYSSSATAITTVYYVSDPGKPDDGSIWDADIELNDINFTFVNVPTTTSPRHGVTNGTTWTTSSADLENTLTHELGHFQGLDHTCWDTSGPATAPLDNNGKAVPDCNDVEPVCRLASADECATISKTTMFNFARPAETIKRMPKADDILGICTVYSTAKMPGTCTRAAATKAHGCSLARSSAATAPNPLALTLPFMALAGLATLLSRRRRAASRAA